MSTASHRTGITAGWLIGGLTSILLVAALVLDVARARISSSCIRSAGALTWLGALLTTRMPEHPISWGFAATGLLWSVGSLAFAYAFEALVAHPGLLPGGHVASWIDNWIWLPGLVLPMSLLLLVVPDGRLLSLRWRLAVVALVGGTALASAGLSGSPTFELGSTQTIENPLALDPGVWHVAAWSGSLVLSARSLRRSRLCPALPPLARRGTPAAPLGRRQPRLRGLSRRDRSVHLGRFPRVRPLLDRAARASRRHRGRGAQVPAVRARPRRQPRLRLRGDDDCRGRRATCSSSA